METPKDRCNPSEDNTVAVSVQIAPSVSSNGNNDPSENIPQGHQCEPNANNENNRSSDAFAKGLSTMLASIIRDFDSKAQDTLKSQDYLNCAIDRLARGHYTIYDVELSSGFVISYKFLVYVCVVKLKCLISLNGIRA